MPTLQELIDRLNPAQKEAVENTDGPALIVAGAGSGKTTVLTARIAALLEKGVQPERIMALTFTRKAAEEMRSRITALEGERAKRLVMGTFHSVFIRILRAHSGRIAFPDNFTILDEDDSRSRMAREIENNIAKGRPPKEEWTEAMKKRYDDEDKHYKPKTIASVISAYKNELVTPEAYAGNEEIRRRDTAMMRPLTWKIFKDYRDACHRMAVMDFDDILLYTDMLLANNPDVLNEVAGGLDYILVDEYQDTNKAQYSILRRLTWLNKNICVVGDDSQSIYAFRGARVENILRFNTDYPGCRVIRLERNYRSTKNIVGAANNLISHNSRRIKKVCFTEREKGAGIILKTCKDEADEAFYVAEKIKSLHESGTPWTEMAVLYRTNSQSRALEEELVKARIPYTIHSGTSFFERLEVKDVMAYLKLAVNPRDDESFLRVVNKPRRAFAEAAQRRLIDIARQWGMPLSEAAANPSITLCGFSRGALAGLEAFTRLLAEAREATATLGAHDAAVRISDLCGIYAGYAEAGDEDSMRRADNIRELIDSVKAYETDTEGSGETPTLAGFLQNATLLSNADTGEDGDKVSLMTVHCSKGLEYGTVLITGLEEDLFPLSIDKTDAELEEERRLFYVAVTRAKDRLFLVNARRRLRFGKWQDTKKSGFIAELSEDAGDGNEDNKTPGE